MLINIYMTCVRNNDALLTSLFEKESCRTLKLLPKQLLLLVLPSLIGGRCGRDTSCLRGRLPIFIQNFLQNQKFKVRLGSTFSASFRQEQGYPQGSILSIILFIVKINAIRQCLSHLTESSLFVDDFLYLAVVNGWHILSAHYKQASMPYISGLLRTASNSPAPKPSVFIFAIAG